MFRTIRIVGNNHNKNSNIFHSHLLPSCRTTCANKAAAVVLVVTTTAACWRRRGYSSTTATSQGESKARPRPGSTPPPFGAATTTTTILGVSSTISLTRHFTTTTTTTTTTINHNHNHSNNNHPHRRTRLLAALRDLDTACLCDAAASYPDWVQIVVPHQQQQQPQSSTTTTDNPDTKITLTLIPSLIPISSSSSLSSSLSFCRNMAGVARTVQCVQPNDFLAVWQGLDDAQHDDVLCVQTQPTTYRALAGELFHAEALRRGVVGLVVDGPVRDSQAIRQEQQQQQQQQQQSSSGGAGGAAACWCFAKSITPYAGTTNALGNLQVPITICGGDNLNIRTNTTNNGITNIYPNHTILVGDDDGLLAFSAAATTVTTTTATAVVDDHHHHHPTTSIITTRNEILWDTLERIVTKAQDIQATEAWVRANLQSQHNPPHQSLHSFTNYHQHVQALKQQQQQQEQQDDNKDNKDDNEGPKPCSSLQFLS